MRKLRLALPSMNGFFTFEAAARCGNFARAADELNVTPAAVSRMMGRLEDHLGIILFDRTPGGVTLTEAGRILYEAVSRGFSGFEHALREIEDRKTGVETVTLSVSTGFTTHWIMPHMAEIKRAFPSLELRFQLIMSALSGPVTDVDLGMRFVDGPDERHEASYIMPEILVPICSPGYRDRQRTLPADAATDSLLTFGDAQPDWSQVFFPGDPGAATNSMIFSDYAIVVQAAMLGQGVALGWLNVTCHWLRTGALVPAGPGVKVTGRHCQFVRSRDKPLRPIVADLRDWITARLSEDARQVAQLYPELGLDAVLTRGRS
ncbi:LysR family transcriptional regulator [Ancylobacter rudongensis]|uniref:DNA-binding transcriptional regulator, LysR family n=1 Tax=Ancylobacter rudongensis TaxID=177413 RepID=A0A1G4TJL1_9HYPH|nr:LysR substrate-binding domain-containing protein [Ancylobacter rudongensis]SCW81610.1 DNA-binding transcriptional regulator, LysR family [Ancylobacter rudongensis]